MQSVTEKIEDTLPPKWRGVFKYRVGTTLDQDPPRFTVTEWVDTEKERESLERFRKTVVLTDSVDWDEDKIVRTYFARLSMEEEFHMLKDVLLIPVMPIFHRLDKRIRVHAFLCVVGLLFYRGGEHRMEEGTEDRVPLKALAARLDRIHVVAMALLGARRVKVVLQELNREQTAVVKALENVRIPNLAE